MYGIFTYIWLIFNDFYVKCYGKYTSPLDPMGPIVTQPHKCVTYDSRDPLREIDDPPRPRGNGSSKDGGIPP